MLRTSLIIYGCTIQITFVPDKNALVSESTKLESGGQKNALLDVVKRGKWHFSAHSGGHHLALCWLEFHQIEEIKKLDGCALALNGYKTATNQRTNGFYKSRINY